MKTDDIVSHVNNLYEMAMGIKKEAKARGVDILSIRSIFSMGFVSICFELGIPPAELDHYFELVSTNYRKIFSKPQKDLENIDDCVTNKVKKKAVKRPRKSKP